MFYSSRLELPLLYIMKKINLKKKIKSLLHSLKKHSKILSKVIQVIFNHFMNNVNHDKVKI